MRDNKLEQKVNELCVLGNIENFKEIVEIILKKIYKAGCQISTRSDGGPSLHEFPDINDKCRIRIDIKKNFKNPIRLIWVILHEFGHHLSGKIDYQSRNDIKLRIDREVEAWKFAKKEIYNYPSLINELSDFELYKDECLDKYKLLSNSEWQSGNVVR